MARPLNDSEHASLIRERLADLDGWLARRGRCPRCCCQLVPLRNGRARFDGCPRCLSDLISESP